MPDADTAFCFTDLIYGMIGTLPVSKELAADMVYSLSGTCP